MDWLTAGLTLLSMELIARRRWEGWLIGLLNQGCWTYLIITQQLWGMTPLVVILTWRFTVAMRQWAKET